MKKTASAQLAEVPDEWPQLDWLRSLGQSPAHRAQNPGRRQRGTMGVELDFRTGADLSFHGIDA
jgi:hypothetical protein